jgi:hypothetical protein
MVSPVNRGFGSLEQGQQGAKTGGKQEAQGGVAGVVEAVKERAQDIASGAAHRAEEAWDTARQGAQRAYSAVTSTAGDAFESLTDYMRRYPVVTLLAGFGLGFLVAQAFSFGGRSESRYQG